MNQLHRILRWAWSILVVCTLVAAKEMTAQPDRREPTELMELRVIRDLRDLRDLRDQGPR
jgi:hypothetical protein